MNKLSILENMGYKITWKLIAVGFYGFKKTKSLLEVDEIVEYLCSTLENYDNSLDEKILLICNKDDPNAFEKLLNNFSNNEATDISLQIRKWQTYLLKRLLDNINNDSLQGLISLMNFWISIECITDCPMDFPNSNNTLSIQHFFTQENFELCLNKNKLWLEREIDNIKNNDFIR